MVKRVVRVYEMYTWSEILYLFLIFLFFFVRRIENCVHFMHK